jgi:hypothetical protein
MNRLVLTLLISGAAVTLCACSVIPPLEPIERKPAPTAAPLDGKIKVTLAEAISRYSPPSFVADPNADVDYSRTIYFDTSLPWGAAFDQALAQAHVDRLTLRTPANVGLEQQLPTRAQQSSAATAAVTVPPSPVRAPLVAQAPIPAIAAAAGPVVAPVDPASKPADVKPTANGVVAQTIPTVEMVTGVRECVASAKEEAAPARIWEAKSNDTLKQTLDVWNHIAGWAMSWNYRDEQTNELTDLTLGAGMKCKGSYRSAVTALINSLPAKEHVGALRWPDDSPPLLQVFNEGKETL